MKRILATALVLMIVLALCPLGVFAADSGECGENLVWSFNGSTGVLSITGTGAMTDYIPYDNAPTPWDGYLEDIIVVNIGDGVTSIGKCAFYGCVNLKSAHIPDSVTSIGRAAFNSCAALEEITIPENVVELGATVFAFCPNLKTVNIFGSVSSIGSMAFADCTSLKSITVPEGAKTVDSSAFSGCTSLETISLPESLETIYGEAFEGCTSLKSIDIPDKVSYIDTRAFYGCTALEEAKLPASLTLIRLYTFYNCTSLKSIVVPEGVEAIEENAFMKCAALSEVTLPNSLKTIEGWVFNEVDITKVTYYGTEADWQAIAISPGNDELKNAKRYYEDVPDVPDTPDDTTLPTWKNESDWTIIDEEGSVAFPNAYGYVFTIDDIDGVIDGEDSSLITTSTDYAECNPAWAVSVALKATETEDVYRVVGIFENPGIGSVSHINWSETSMVFVVHSATTNPALAEESGYHNWKSRAAALALNVGESVMIDNMKMIVQNRDGSFTPIESDPIVPGPTEPATEGTCGDDLTWKFDETTGVITISGEGDMYNYEYDRDTEGYTTPWYELRDVIAEVVIEEGVTGIGDYAFKNCVNVEGISVCEGVKSLGIYAFSDCDKVVSISIPDSVTEMSVGVFDNSDKLETVDMPERLDTKDISIFYGCVSLKSVVIPEGVEWLGDCFAYCKSLTSVTLPDSITLIGHAAFYECESLETIELPDSVETISMAAFEKCKNLKTVELPEKLTEIMSLVFYGCESLESVVIPENVTEIGMSAFDGCGALTSVTIPKGVTTISSYAFYNCNSLETVYFGGTEEEWNAISVGGDNDPLLNAEIVFNYCPHEKCEWNVLEDGTKEKVCNKCGEVLETLGADERIPNDINGDNKFNVFDYVMVKNACLNGTDDEALLEILDINGDGRFNLFDYVAIKAAYFAQ